MTWNFYVDESTKGRYDMVLDRDILTFLGLYLKPSEHAIKADDGPFKESTAPIIDLGTY